MIPFRRYGTGPAPIVLVHGGPGAPGEMAPVARNLSGEYIILEPMQTESTVRGQITELAGIIQSEGDIPVILIGYSWGAWLSGMVASHFPHLVRKLVLISCGPLEETYSHVWKNRMDRLTPNEREEIHQIIRLMENPADPRKDEYLARFGHYMSRIDSYHPVCESIESDSLPGSHDIHHAVWNEAAAMRRSGELLGYFRSVTCPVVAIHGTYDPHPWEGVQEPLSPVLTDFRMILLEKCGHTPWCEAEAKDRFFTELKAVLSE